MNTARIDKTRPAEWREDILPGFEQLRLLPANGADSIEIVLVRRRCNEVTKAAALYIHGFIDYFFQIHLADFYNEQNLHFYALDLRRHGRSLHPGQRANFTRNVDEYFLDLDAAIAYLQTCEDIDWLLLNGHSTGGLLAALYGHRGLHRKSINAIFLNSPFLDMNVPAWQAHFLLPMLSWLGSVFPYLRYPGISPIYAESIHADHHGQWQFRTDWKPIKGFPVYAGWFRAIHKAHVEIAKGLHIQCPCLVMHSYRSLRLKKWSVDAQSCDTVLNVADIQRLSPGLGKQIEMHAIQDGLHDLTLSNEPVQKEVWRKLSSWLDRIRRHDPFSQEMNRNESRSINN